MVLLDGPLGVGKTTFCQHFIGTGEVLSPTYSVLSENGQVLHGDFYRLEKQDELIALEIPIYLEGKHYFLAEWGEKFSRRLLRELPETWSAYSLELSFGKPAAEGEEPSRNFALSSVADDWQNLTKSTVTELIGKFCHRGKVAPPWAVSAQIY